MSADPKQHCDASQAAAASLQYDQWQAAQPRQPPRVAAPSKICATVRPTQFAPHHTCSTSFSKVSLVTSRTARTQVCMRRAGAAVERRRASCRGAGRSAAAGARARAAPPSRPEMEAAGATHTTACAATMVGAAAGRVGWGWRCSGGWCKALAARLTGGAAGRRRWLVARQRGRGDRRGVRGLAAHETLSPHGRSGGPGAPCRLPAAPIKPAQFVPAQPSGPGLSPALTNPTPTARAPWPLRRTAQQVHCPS